ncbi:hypothetical protein [Clostridium estertheticum]|nr:hypothetical protein [Clostridium estertheticum]MBZ9617864.1 hypothetical protein [Clostridium estertheticum subsp. laramiense]
MVSLFHQKIRIKISGQSLNMNMIKMAIPLKLQLQKALKLEEYMML